MVQSSMRKDVVNVEYKHEPTITDPKRKAAEEVGTAEAVAVMA